MKKRNSEENDYSVSESLESRRGFLKKMVLTAALFICPSVLKKAQAAEDVPAEPGNLDEPTPLQEGDPEPYEMTIPAEEPEQSSTEAPPSQPIDDVRPDQPGTDHAWLNGYWWWTNNQYIWVPGYWAIPPKPGYHYVAGYWIYQGGRWIYVRGGWAEAYGTVVVVYHRRPLFTALVITAPIRIIRRHRRWRHHHQRRYHHRARRSPARQPGKRPGTPQKRPVTTPGKKQPSRKPSSRPSSKPSSRPSSKPSTGRKRR